uniref:Large ribosomal subunit protein uL6 alpha-beta domain-containing protein n=1 Tax=Cyanidium caldarium TaxID=2771 RepID=Q9TLU6_CYACA|nr:ribosomal protein L6 [Cyanidium caldarium]AAF12921.1 unknown [Cyanidium caldarium]WDB00298.1 ribosomal protein L6 [Cyanidium caldarium]
MSRIGKKSILLNQNVQVDIKDQVCIVKGQKGTLQRKLPCNVELIKRGPELFIIPVDLDTVKKRRLHGLLRTLINNMVIGVSIGFSKKLEIHGVGYKAHIADQHLVLTLGYSHVIKFLPPEGVSLLVENNNIVLVKGIDKEKVGLASACIRSIKPPEVYKGKGIRYAGELVRRKLGKASKNQ